MLCAQRRSLATVARGFAVGDLAACAPVVAAEVVQGLGGRNPDAVVINAHAKSEEDFQTLVQHLPNDFTRRMIGVFTCSSIARQSSSSTIW